MINAIGSIPGFAGPYLFGYLSTKTGSFVIGLTVLMVTALAGELVVLRSEEKGVTNEDCHESHFRRLCKAVLGADNSPGICWNFTFDK
jgi:hypothetical protein